MGSISSIVAAKKEEEINTKIDKVFGSASPVEPAAILLRRHARILAADKGNELRWTVTIIDLVTMIATLVLVGRFLWILMALYVSYGPGLFLGGLIIIPVVVPCSIFLWTRWMEFFERSSPHANPQEKLLIGSAPIAFGFAAEALFARGYALNPKNWLIEGLLQGVELSAISLSLLVGGGVLLLATHAILRARYRSLRPISYLLNALFEALYLLDKIRTGEVLDWDTPEKRAPMLAHLEEAARCLAAVSIRTPANDRSFAVWKEQAFKQRVQGLRELKMAVVLPKADTRDWLEQELRRILGRLASGDWDGLPVNKYDLHEHELLFKQLLRVTRSLLIPAIIFISVYLAKDQQWIPKEAIIYLIFTAVVLTLMTVLPIIDPDVMEKFLKLKEMPKIPFGGKSKE